MKEYTILIRQGSGSPYMLGTYSDIILAKRAILNLVEFEEERNKMYFVDNDFFYNKYVLCGNLKYMCIKEREVSEWVKYEETNVNIKSSKIINLNKYFKNT